MKIEEFDKHVSYTLRVDLVNGKGLLYPIDTANKQMLMDLLMENTIGDIAAKALTFLWFETSLPRKVAINTSAIAHITFCFDRTDIIEGDAMEYRDNFSVLAGMKQESEEEDEAMTESLPQAIIYHKGATLSGGYPENPLMYYELDPSCLWGFDLEFDGDMPLRQFLNLTDDDGEESFIPLANIVVMEFDSELFEEPE